ncbi:MAG: hypothetical protein EB127_04955 [Alphaproteobacteria bacterium]|jgi:hypothetical protein|nr:hypothetical protein [Alphaproteobacteria bacterium]
MEIDDLILSGALEPAGIDPETGELLYNFTDKLSLVSPVLAREVANMFDSHVMKLWELGMVSMDVMDENPIVKLTPKAFDTGSIKSLDEEIAYTLKEIKRHISRQ